MDFHGLIRASGVTMFTSGSVPVVSGMIFDGAPTIFIKMNALGPSAFKSLPGKPELLRQLQPD
jgi:hypothetical protein